MIKYTIEKWLTPNGKNIDKEGITPDYDVNIGDSYLNSPTKENDMQLKYNIYQQVVEQLQLAQAKVQEKTPAFTVVQSASVPIRPSSRSKIMTIFIWMFLGFIVRATILGWNQLRLFIIQ